jgi:2-oxo-4-hydroxy-4-carboxy-5-ureidoimidazoline decarboxylase
VDRIRIEDQLSAPSVDLETVNMLGVDGFTAMLGGIFEHSSWVARISYAGRPFISVTALHATMVSVVMNSGMERQLTLLRAHPELARPGPLTAASTAEQGGMGLDRLEADEAAAFDALNAAYRHRFGFPFIIAVRGLQRADILAAFERRIGNSPQDEFRTALDQVHKIARLRLVALARPS